jgi:hypothetical protein
MPFNFPTFVNPNPIVDGIANKIEGADVNSLFTITNGINDTLSKLTGLTSAVTSVDTTIVANTTVILFVDASAGNRAIEFPEGADQLYSSIIVKKIDNTANTVTINKATGSSDFFEDPSAPVATPATRTSIVLRSPDESIELLPQPNNTSIWRIINRYINLGWFGAKAYATGNTILTLANTLYDYPYNNDSATNFYDYSSSYNTTTFTYTCKIPGNLLCNISGGNFSTSNRSFVMNTILNSSIVDEREAYSLANTDIGFGYVSDLRVNVGDTIKIQARANVANSNTRLGSAISNISFKYLSTYYV